MQILTTAVLISLIQSCKNVRLLKKKTVKMPRLRREQTCARCNVPGAVLKINLLGRLVYIDRVPVILAPGRARVALYSALDVVLPKHLPQDARLEWGRQINCIQFKNLLANVTFTQFFLTCNDNMLFYTQVRKVCRT